jgi:membrane-associated phospholipid phosphatase
VPAILLALVWPVGIACIVGAGVLAALRTPRGRPPEAPPVSGPPAPASAAAPPGGTFRPAARSPVSEVARFLVIAIPGAVAVAGVMALVGLLVVHAGPAIDKPVYHWIAAHRLRLWAAEMTKATRVGDTWTVRGAAVVAAVCLAVTWHRRRWLPPVALGLLVLMQRLLTHGLHTVIHRVGPPAHPHGVFPSGGAERSIVFYGLIAYLLWREFSGTRRGAILAGTVIAVLAFNEGYSRAYLGMHWLTDILSGWLYGCLLLIVFIAAVRLVGGSAREPARPPLPAPDRTAALESHERS